MEEEETQVTLWNGFGLVLLTRPTQTGYLGHNLDHICDVALGAQDGLLSIYNKLSLVTKKKGTYTFLILIHHIHHILAIQAKVRWQRIWR